MALLLLIPAGMIRSLIRKREYAFQQVYAEVGEKWGSPQTLAGTVITVLYLVYALSTDEKVVTTRKNAYFLPEMLSVTGEVTP